MKNGFFKSPSLSILLLALLCLPGCSSFLLQFGDHGENPAEYDRGYEVESDSENPESETVSMRESEESSASNELEYGKRRVKRAIASRDVVLGMTRKEVSDSWGHPTQREVAGRGNGGHERWTYGSRFSLSGSRTVIFENGRVAGWNQ